MTPELAPAALGNAGVEERRIRSNSRFFENGGTERLGRHAIIAVQTFSTCSLRRLAIGRTNGARPLLAAQRRGVQPAFGHRQEGSVWAVPLRRRSFQQSFSGVHLEKNSVGGSNHTTISLCAHRRRQRIQLPRVDYRDESPSRVIDPAVVPSSERLFRTPAERLAMLPYDNPFRRHSMREIKHRHEPCSKKQAFHANRRAMLLVLSYLFS